MGVRTGYTVNVVYTGDGNHEPLEGATVTLTVRRAALTVTANPVEVRRIEVSVNRIFADRVYFAAGESQAEFAQEV